MSNVTPLFARPYRFNSELERHLVEDHLVDEGFRLDADRWYQLQAHRSVHQQDRSELHDVEERA